MIFVIEETLHAESVCEHSSLEAVWLKLLQMSQVPWGQPPHSPPCAKGLRCERSYEVAEYDEIEGSWHLVRRLGGFDISSRGLVWHEEDQWEVFRRAQSGR
jgi:hypothetical protein